MKKKTDYAWKFLQPPIKVGMRSLDFLFQHQCHLIFLTSLLFSSLLFSTRMLGLTKWIINLVPQGYILSYFYKTLRELSLSTKFAEFFIKIMVFWLLENAFVTQKIKKLVNVNENQSIITKRFNQIFRGKSYHVL